MIIKVVLVASIAMFLLYTFRARRQSAAGRMFVIALSVVMAVFSVAPDLSTLIANKVGVTRGADLLFYLSHMLTIFVAFGYFLKFKDVDARLTQLARAQALANAEPPRSSGS